MNWDMIGALGELIGALAVVLALFYLAHQLRDSAEEVDEALAESTPSLVDTWHGNE